MVTLDNEKDWTEGGKYDGSEFGQTTAEGGSSVTRQLQPGDMYTTEGASWLSPADRLIKDMNLSAPRIIA